MGTGVGAAALAWALVEATAFTVRRVGAGVLEPGARPMRVLHLTDLHLAPWQRRKQEWLRGLVSLEPDLTVVTGDMLGHQRAVPLVLEALGGLLDGPGVFVLGSNDYVAPRLSNPLGYLRGPSERSEDWEPLPTEDLVAGLTGRGWVDADNARAAVMAGGNVVDVVGVDDPHHELDRFPPAAGRAQDSVLRLGVAHAPYRRVLDAMARDGAGLVLAGHTHGGQVCVPGWGALVTNCDLAPRYASGVFAWQAARRPGDDPWSGGPRTTVHVSGGLGTNPFLPVRVACRPSVTVLTLHPRAA